MSNNAIPDRELFIRWMQFGLYSPVFRAHGSQSPREPFMYDEETTALLREVIQQRYRILPYIYSSAYQTYSEGVPIMRPLFLDHGPDELTLLESDAYHFGDWLLVRPVTEPQSTLERLSEQGEPAQIELPAGSSWWHFPSLRRVQGLSVPLPQELEAVPAFAREGAIIPLQSTGRPDPNAGVTTTGWDSLLVLPSATETSYVVYSDDGVRNEPTNAEYLQVELSATELQFSGAASARSITLQTAADLVPADASALWEVSDSSNSGVATREVSIGIGDTVIRLWQED